MIERELRYLVRRSNLPENLGPGEPLQQGYLSVGPGIVLRLRRSGVEPDLRWRLTIKAPYVDHTAGAQVPRGSQRREVEIEVSAAQAAELWPLCGERIVAKTRYRVALGEPGLWAEVDIFAGRWDGLVMVEVEFDSSQQLRDFQPPAWFGPEVTSEERFGNAGLALATDAQCQELRALIAAECAS